MSSYVSQLAALVVEEQALYAQGWLEPQDRLRLATIQAQRELLWQLERERRAALAHGRTPQPILLPTLIPVEEEEPPTRPTRAIQAGAQQLLADLLAYQEEQRS